ncbi:hypothetical protein HRbin23_00444 [bacterium HR23]|nr:hypothetical protein HRbin23_00444 [bacterium HR23]
MASIPTPLQEALGRLPQGLQDHLLRTASIARELAQFLGVDGEKASLSALAHDLCRAEPPSALLHEARHRELAIHPVEEAVPLLLHGPVAAERLRDMGIHDPEVLDAVRWHSTAHPALTPVGKVVFLADKLDEGKHPQPHPLLQKVANLARRDVNTALLVYLQWQIQRLVESGSPLHPATLEAWNALLLAGGLAPDPSKH